MEGIQGGPLLLRPGHAVIYELGSGPAAGRGEGPEGEELILGRLAGGTDTAVETDATACLGLGGVRRVPYTERAHRSLS
jgi:hypothetical protein